MEYKIEALVGKIKELLVGKFVEQVIVNEDRDQLGFLTDKDLVVIFLEADDGGNIWFSDVIGTTNVHNAKISDVFPVDMSSYKMQDDKNRIPKDAIKVGGLCIKSEVGMCLIAFRGAAEHVWASTETFDVDETIEDGEFIEEVEEWFN